MPKLDKIKIDEGKPIKGLERAIRKMDSGVMEEGKNMDAEIENDRNTFSESFENDIEAGNQILDTVDMHCDQTMEIIEEIRNQDAYETTFGVSADQTNAAEETESARNNQSLGKSK